MRDSPGRASGRFLGEVEVIERRELGQGAFVLGLDVRLGAEPGQFAMVSAPGHTLPRPFSVYGDSPLRLLIKRVGPVSRWLGKREAGDVILVWGPLGRPYPKIENALLVAGGVGVAPLAFYARKHGGKLVLGLPGPAPGWLRELGDIEPLIASERPWKAFRGTAVELAREVWRGEVVMACGPRPMLVALLDFVPKDRLFVSLEGMMGCGLGICMGCAVPRADGGYLRLCTEGPGVWASEISL